MEKKKDTTRTNRSLPAAAVWPNGAFVSDFPSCTPVYSTIHRLFKDFQQYLITRQNMGLEDMFDSSAAALTVKKYNPSTKFRSIHRRITGNVRNSEERFFGGGMTSADEEKRNGIIRKYDHPGQLIRFENDAFYHSNLRPAAPAAQYPGNLEILFLDFGNTT